MIFPPEVALMRKRSLEAQDDWIRRLCLNKPEKARACQSVPESGFWEKVWGESQIVHRVWICVWAFQTLWLRPSAGRQRHIEWSVSILEDAPASARGADWPTLGWLKVFAWFIDNSVEPWATRDDSYGPVPRAGHFFLATAFLFSALIELTITIGQTQPMQAHGIRANDRRIVGHVCEASNHRFA